jgi:7-cyano-7-deazaguanine synthase
MALVLLSGGVDSTTCLYIARREFGEAHVTGVSINYGQRHLKEIEQAKKICDNACCDYEVLEIPGMPKSMLTDPDAEVPSISYADMEEGVSPTYVPFRNGQLLSRVAGYAQAEEYAAIYFGAHAEDAQNWAYPDCTPEFIGAMANAIYVGTYHQVRLHTPLEWLCKMDIIRWGDNLGVPWDLTWSCYKGDEFHCGTCPTCRARREGFIDAGVEDPTIYVPDLETNGA